MIKLIKTVFNEASVKIESFNSVFIPWLFYGRKSELRESSSFAVLPFKISLESKLTNFLRRLARGSKPDESIVDLDSPSLYFVHPTERG